MLEESLKAEKSKEKEKKGMSTKFPEKGGVRANGI